MAKTVAVTNFTTPINTMAAAAVVGAIDVVKTLLKSNVKYALRNLVCHPIARNPTSQILRDPVLAAASTGKAEVVHYLLHTMDSWGSRGHTKLRNNSVPHIYALSSIAL